MTAAVTAGVNGHGDTERWVTVTQAATARGVTRRTVKRWVAENRCVSRLVTETGRELRLIREDTLPSVTGAPVTDDSEARTGDVPRVTLSAGESTGTDDEHRCASGDDTVTRQAEEIAFLRAQLQRRDQAEEQLRMLLMQLERTNAELAGALVMKALPPAQAREDQPRRVRWWWPWR